MILTIKSVSLRAQPGDHWAEMIDADTLALGHSALQTPHNYFLHGPITAEIECNKSV